VTQLKGTSETHPLLSDTDEWAGFEIMPFRVGTKLPSKPEGSYVREAYRTVPEPRVTLQCPAIIHVPAGRDLCSVR